MGAIRVRVRGIYATSLTKIFLDEGYQIVQPSKIIASRFNIPEVCTAADVTVKDGDEPGTLVVIGYSSAVKDIVSVLRKWLRYSVFNVSVLPLHATIVVKIVGMEEGKCIGEFNGVKVVIEGLDVCEKDRLVTTYVVSPGLSREVIVKPGVRVLGDYAFVTLGDNVNAGVSFSKHVKSVSLKAKLHSIASEFISKNMHVHWRSSVRCINEDEAKLHLRELVQKAQELVNMKVDSPTLLSDGELVALVKVSFEDKLALDNIRSLVVKTLRLHHYIKSCYPTNIQEMLDFAEKALNYDAPEEPLLKAMIEVLAEYIKQQCTVRIYHEKLDGTIISLGTAHIKGVSIEDGKICILLHRVVKSEGIYDGIEEPKEPGDIIESKLCIGDWTLVHKYLSKDGVLKGTYININTPVEFCNNSIRYIDLELDVARSSKGEKLLDLDKLRDYVSKGMITNELYCKALNVALGMVRNEHNASIIVNEIKRVCTINLKT